MNDEKKIENNVELEVENFVDPLDTLIKLELNKNEEINIEEYSEIIDTLERDLSLKSEDTDEIIKEIGEKYVNKDYLTDLIKSYENIKNFYKKYDPNDKDVQKLSKNEKDNLFKVGSFLNKNYTKLINNLLFTITLTKKEYIFLDTVLTKKMNYDGTEVFNMIELNELYIKPWKEKFKTRITEDFTINIDISNIVMIYHFLQSYSVKGTGDEFNRFVSLLQKIAETNKIYNAFNIKKELANSNFLAWNSNLTPIEEQQSEEQLEQTNSVEKQANSN